MTAKEESYFDKFCRTSDDPCLAIKIQTNNAIDAAYEKMGAMQRDPQGLFRNAYSAPNPSVTETNTTWIGHKVELERRIAAVNSMISLGQKMGCDMTPEIIRSQGLYVPNMPTGVR